MYHSVAGPNIQSVQPAHFDNIELDTKYDPAAYKYSPPPGHPPDNLSGKDIDVDSKYSDDKKPFFRANSAERPVGVQWPNQAQRVTTMTPLRGAIAFFDAFLASTPIMFVALALTAAGLDGKDVSDYGFRLEETLLLSPTIFPLIFAAMMGRFFRHLGGYLAERGTTLGRLEQLVGCQSVFTALERQITLRSWSIVGVLSVLVWLLSPIGSQSALRLLGQETKSVSMMSNVRYLDPQSVTKSALQGASAMNSGRATFTSIFLAALLSSSRYQNTAMDLWGNVKLPLYRQIANSSTSEWKRAIGENGANATYGSLIGVPIVGMPSDGWSNFTIRARQFDVTCDRNELVLGKRNESLWENRTSTWFLDFNKTATQNARVMPYPVPILSMSMVSDELIQNYSIASCNVNYLYLESQVNCNGTSCGVVAMRKLPLVGDGYTADDDIVTRGNIINGIMTAIPTVDNINVGSAIARGSTNAEKWIANPGDFIGARFDNVALYKLDPDEFATRLTILWNTFHQSSFATTALGGALPENLTQTGLLVGTSFNSNFTFNATRANVIQREGMVYKTNWKWFSALLVSSIILLAASYAALVLKYMTLAPDIIGYASSLAILNPYVPAPTGGTTLHGLERTALLHDMPVRIGDVCANEPNGAISFAIDDGRVTRLDRRRWYI